MIIKNPASFLMSDPLVSVSLRYNETVEKLPLPPLMQFSGAMQVCPDPKTLIVGRIMKHLFASPHH